MGGWHDVIDGLGDLENGFCNINLMPLTGEKRKEAPDVNISYVVKGEASTYQRHRYKKSVKFYR